MATHNEPDSLSDWTWWEIATRFGVNRELPPPTMSRWERKLKGLDARPINNNEHQSPVQSDKD